MAYDGKKRFGVRRFARTQGQKSMYSIYMYSIYIYIYIYINFWKASVLIYLLFISIENFYVDIVIAYNLLYTGWARKMSLFFFGNNFYKNKETFKIFSPQLLEVYRILLVETTLESIMFYYNFLNVIS